MRHPEPQSLRACPISRAWKRHRRILAAMNSATHAEHDLQQHARYGGRPSAPPIEGAETNTTARSPWSLRMRSVHRAALCRAPGAPKQAFAGWH